MIAYSPLSPNPIGSAPDWQHWHQCTPSVIALSLSTLAQNNVCVVFCETNHHAESLKQNCLFFNTVPCHILPDWEVLPFDQFSPHDDIISERLKTLYHLPHLDNGIVIVPLSTAISRLLPKGYLNTECINLKVGDQLNIDSWKNNLSHAGYSRSAEVMRHGEFAVRGSIIDVYPMGSELPIRIDTFDDDIDSIRYFDPETQRSLQTVSAIELLPANEYALNEAGVTHFRQQFRQRFDINPSQCTLYQSVSQGEPCAGLEFYLPLFYSNTSSLFDYLPNDAIIIFNADLQSQLTTIYQEVEERYNQLAHDRYRPILQPREINLEQNQFNQQLKQWRRISCHNQSRTESKQGHGNFAITALPHLHVEHNHKDPISHLRQFISKFDGKIIMCAESNGRKEILLELLASLNINFQECSDFKDALSNDTRHQIVVGPIQSGFIDDHHSFALIGEADLFGKHVSKQRKKAARVDPSQLIHSLAELKPGDAVAHITHGIGIYRGLTHLKTGDIQAEYLILEYADNDKIYVPIDRLDVISRYSSQSNNAPITKLGSGRWSKQKQQALKRVRDVAAELLVLYSKRQATPGYAFSPPNSDFKQFRESFPFAETADQELAINAVIGDMTKAQAMDRLICGDVGFGKTEVAMQAAALAIQSGKQVAVLVPTTLLVSQHTESFQNRFANWPVKISGISRFNASKQTQKILENLASGHVDVIIGTHRLLSDDIQFKDLGLLIVDEEHRFGVRHKDKIKAMRANVDILTLTATPIPRTLNMAFSGMRDMSVIATAPEKRLSVKTFLRERSDPLIQEAVAREMHRGGQVYFLHNSVETIYAVRDQLQILVPNARIGVGHGQMPKRELEQVMLDFYHQRINILIATTIIESGIDVPSANTIIIDRANNFGLAQLHQLRGRVGRSHHQAYAYLLIPSLKGMNKDAAKRLQALTEVDSLGAGFHLANHDLEIRGAGELLGDEQSGHMQALGFSLYMEMLEAAVEALKNGEEFHGLDHERELDIDLHISSLIPETMIADISTRLSLYKRLADCCDIEHIDELKVEMIDRFGKLPEPCENLIAISKLRLTCKAIGIKKIDMNKQYGHLYFDDKPKLRFEKVIELIQKQSRQYQLLNNNTLRINAQTIAPEKRLETIETVISKIT